MQYTVILSPEEGLWAVFCPAMDIASQGDSKEHALRMIREAMGLWSEWAVEHHVEPHAETLDFITAYIGQVLADRAEEGLPPAIELLQISFEPTAAAA